MEQVGTGFVQVVPSFSDFHRSVGRQVRRGLTEAGTQGGRDMGRAVSRGFSGALGGVGTALNRTGQQIARAASSIRPVDRAVRGLSAGLRGTYLETTGAAGALNSMGLAAQVAVTMARDGSRLLSAGLHGVGVSASESGTRMYRLGNTASGVFQGAARGARAVSDGVRGLGASVSGWVRDARSEVTGLGGALTRMGAVGAAAIAALGFGALAVDVARVASSAQTTEASLLALYGAAGGGAKEVNDLMAEMDVRFAHLDLSVMREGATSLAYMGVQGKAAVEILENLEAATTASGTGAEGMSRAFAAMTSGVNAGAFQMDTLNQISDAGIPIYDALSDVLGVDIPEAQKMASDGAIGLEEVLQALDGEHGTWFPALIEGAENVGNTFSGAWSTIKNTVVNGLASEVVPLVDKLTPTMLGVASAISSGFDRLPGLLSDIKSHLSDAGIIDGFLGLVSGARELVTALAPAALTFAQTFLPALASVLLVLDPLGKALQITAGWMRENEEVVKLLGVGLGAATAAIVAIAVAKGVWAAVTWGLAAAINATGIPLLIIGIAALIAGVIYAYKNFDGFRERVDAAAGAIKGAASAIWQKGLKPAFDALRHGLSLIGDGATWLWENALGPALGGIMGGFRGAGEAALWLWEKGISPAWDAISFGARLLFTVISTVLITPLYLAFQLVAATATWLWQNAFQPAWEGIAAGATWLWTSALQPTWQAAQAALSLLGAAFTWLWSAAAQPVLAFLSTGVQEWWKTTRAAFSAAVSFIRGVLAAVFTWLRDKVVRPVFSALSSTISGGARAWRSSLDAIRSWIRGTLGPVFTWLRDSVVTPVMNGIRSVISSVWQNGIRPSFEALRNGVDRVKRSFELARDGIRTAWNQLRSITRKPVEFIVNSVYNRGIRRVWNSVADLVDMKNLPSYSFDRGGIMPGYTPGRDVHLFASPTGGLLELSGGEAIMRPEWTRAVGPQFIDMMNSAARNGGISRVRSMMAGAPHQAFSGGGIFSGISSFASGLASIFDGDGLAGSARRALEPLVGSMRGRFTQGHWAKAMVGIPPAMIDSLVEWLRSTIGPKMGGTGKSVAEAAASHIGKSGNPNDFTRAFNMAGQPWCAMFVSEIIKQVRAQDAYHNIRSAAVSAFADSSMESVRGVANAQPGDLAVYRGKGPGNWGHINIYEGDGKTIGGNESNAVRRSFTYASRADKFMRPKRMASGGIWQQDRDFTAEAITHPLTRLLRAGEDEQLFDSGGWLRPGMTAVRNATGQPEAVLTPSQSEALVRIAKGRSQAGSGHTFHLHEVRSARVTAQATTTALRDYESLHPVP